jgi:hypothetical protein
VPTFETSRRARVAGGGWFWAWPLAGLVVALTLSGAASAAARPSERACLLAWNAPANAVNRPRLVRNGPWVSASLRPTTAGTVTWKLDSNPTQTTAQACVLTLAKSGRLQIITGMWREGDVTRWSFGRAIPVDKAPAGSNVKVLPDGRVTKIYLR